MRKSKFFTFIFALMPGAGQMYQGQMKRGMSLMLTFFAVIAFAVLLDLAPLTVVLPVIWFYAFFDCMNKSSYTIEELSMCEDRMIFESKFGDGQFLTRYSSQKNTIIGSAVILLGFLLLYNSIIKSFLWRLERYLPGLAYAAQKLPIFILSVILILVGIRLVKGPQSGKVGEEPYE